MSFFKRIAQSVGNGLTNAAADIRTVKDNLTRQGYFNEAHQNDYITRGLDTGIKAFQRDNNLKVDGILFPDGETERALIGKADTPSDSNPKPTEPSTTFIGFGGIPSGTINPVTPRTKPEGFFSQVTRNLSASENQEQEKQSIIIPERPKQTAQEPLSKPAPTDAAGRIIRDEEKVDTIPIPYRKPLDSPNRPTILKGVDNEEVIKTTLTFEDDKVWMYKDTADDNDGWVTIGIGRALKTVDQAKQVPFRVKDENAPGVSVAPRRKKLSAPLTK